MCDFFEHIPEEKLSMQEHCLIFRNKLFIHQVVSFCWLLVAACPILQHITSDSVKKLLLWFTFMEVFMVRAFANLKRNEISFTTFCLEA